MRRLQELEKARWEAEVQKLAEQLRQTEGASVPAPRASVDTVLCLA